MIMDEFIQDFLSRLMLPEQRATSPFILGIIGNLGSGKSTLARILMAQLPGSVVISADSARYLLKEKDMPWGNNVRDIVRDVAEKLLKDGYAVILDGSNAELKERQQTEEIAALSNVPVRYIRIKASYEIYRKRLEEKYNDTSWQSSFERFRVNTTEKMLANLKERQKLHDTLKDEEIAGLVGTIDNDGSQVDLDKKTGLLTEQVLKSLT